MAPFFTGTVRGFFIAAAGARLSATGGDIANGLTPGNGFRYHTFSAPGNFIAPTPGTIEVFLVGGGGGAGAPLGSGGGGGGLVYHSAFSITSGTYPVTVGAGGPGATGPGTPGTNTTGSKGSDSTFGGMTAVGGGGGAPFWTDGITPPNQVSGGSGGGFSPPAPGSATQPAQNSPFTPSPFFSQFGFNGSPGGDPIGGAGGGAGGAGSPGGTGGAGRQYPQFAGPLIGLPGLNPLNGFFAGGGAAGSRSSPLAGGSGGGGPSAPTPGLPNDYGAAGQQYSGGGAGGGFYFSLRGGSTASAGGSGIVVIRYQA